MSATFDPSIPLPLPGAPRLRATSVAAKRAPSHGAHRLLHLDTGDLVRIVHGPGVVVRARSGVLWITDEHSPDDVVLRAGDAHRIARNGVTIVEAHRASRLEIEVPAGCAAPNAIELLLRDGVSRRIPLFGSPTLAWFGRLMRRIACVFSAPRRPRIVGEGYPPAPRQRGAGREDPTAHTPEAVRERLLSAHLHPYY